MRCDIIIPVWNQLEYTRDCVTSIINNTDDVDYGVVIIDNASDGQTRMYLDSLVTGAGSRFRVIRKECNVGFVKAVNEGMRISGAPYVCVLNNDTLVTKGWLKEMLDIAGSRKDIGLVNPSSNNLGQRPSEGESVDLFAQRLKAESGNSIELGAAIGFCMLIKKELIDRIGYFDEVYGMGNFEDTDYSRRSIKEGYRCVRACGAYVCHREGSSFKKIGTYEEDFKRNREIFEFRWGKPKRLAYIIEPSGNNVIRRIGEESLKLAREGNWVWYFSDLQIDGPLHSNIIYKEGPMGYLHRRALFTILKKKKKFDIIFVGDEKIAAILNALRFLHKAKVEYY